MMLSKIENDAGSDDWIVPVMAEIFQADKECFCQIWEQTTPQRIDKNNAIFAIYF
jgi:hypothetical protein